MSAKIVTRLTLVVLMLGAAGCAATVPVPPAARRGPEAERRTLSNGVRLVLSEQRAVPIVSMSCMVDGGVRLDDPKRPGLASLTAGLMDEGTKGRSAQEIATLIESLGGSFSTNSSADWVAASAAVLARDFATGVDLMAESLRRPSFSPRDLERLRAQTLGRLKSGEDNPGYVAAREFQALLYGEGPYGPPSLGTPDSVRAIRREHVVAHHASHIRPEWTICAAVGDVPTQRMFQVFQEALGDWQAAAPAPPQREVRVGTPARRVVDKPVTQANITIGHLGLPRAHPDHFPVLVMNHVLGGGGFTSRLMGKVRTESGLAYSIYSQFSQRRLAGPFQVVLQTKVESAPAAVRMVRDEIRRVFEGGVTEAELAAAKDYLTGSFPLRLESTGKLASFLALVEYYGLGDDYADQYASLVRRVTRDDVLRVARAHLRPDALFEVIVAPEGAMDDDGDRAENSSRNAR